MLTTSVSFSINKMLLLFLCLFFEFVMPLSFTIFDVMLNINICAHCMSSHYVIRERETFKQTDTKNIEMSFFLLLLSFVSSCILLLLLPFWVSVAQFFFGYVAVHNAIRVCVSNLWLFEIYSFDSFLTGFLYVLTLQCLDNRLNSVNAWPSEIAYLYP